MSHRALDEGVVRNKLDAISRAITTLESVSPLDAHRLRSDAITAAAVERLTCRVVELAVDINTHISAAVLERAPESYRASFDLLREEGVLTAELAEKIKPSVGMRNAIVHEYITIDYGIVAAAVPIALETYAEYRRQVARFVVEHGQS